MAKPTAVTKQAYTKQTATTTVTTQQTAATDHAVKKTAVTKAIPRAAAIAAKLEPYQRISFAKKTVENTTLTVFYLFESFQSS